MWWTTHSLTIGRLSSAQPAGHGSSPNWESGNMEVVCAGNLVADIFANPVAALPAAGQLGLTEGFLFGAGGCATNVAACLRRLGRQATAQAAYLARMNPDAALSTRRWRMPARSCGTSRWWLTRALTGQASACLAHSAIIAESLQTSLTLQHAEADSPEKLDLPTSESRFRVPSPAPVPRGRRSAQHLLGLPRRSRSTFAAGPDEAGFWPVISRPSLTT